MMLRLLSRWKSSQGHAKPPTFVSSAIAALVVRPATTPRLVRAARERIRLLTACDWTFLTTMFTSCSSFRLLPHWILYPVPLCPLDNHARAHKPLIRQVLPVRTQYTQSSELRLTIRSGSYCPPSRFRPPSPVHPLHPLCPHDRKQLNFRTAHSASDHPHLPPQTSVPYGPQAPPSISCLSRHTNLQAANTHPYSPFSRTPPRHTNPRPAKAPAWFAASVRRNVPISSAQLPEAPSGFGRTPERARTRLVGSHRTRQPRIPPWLLGLFQKAHGPPPEFPP